MVLSSGSIHLLSGSSVAGQILELSHTLHHVIAALAFDVPSLAACGLGVFLLRLAAYRGGAR